MRVGHKRSGQCPLRHVLFFFLLYWQIFHVEKRDCLIAQLMSGVAEKVDQPISHPSMADPSLPAFSLDAWLQRGVFGIPIP